MPVGTLEVLLISAKGLENTDYLCNMDPYVVLTCRSQEQKSSIASGKGSNPEWNETFIFSISEGAKELNLKIMDSDTGTQDDLVGRVRIPLDPVYHEGSLPATVYNVVKDEQYCGEIKVGLNFAPEVSGSLLVSHKIVSFSLVQTKGILFHRKEVQEIFKWKKKTMVDGSSPHICNNDHTTTP